jgi:hypothetical protein
VSSSQPTPVKNDYPFVAHLVTNDLWGRVRHGIETYGTPLQPHNGRDALWDAYEEAINLYLYLRQAIFERDHPAPSTPKSAEVPDWSAA